MKPGLKTLFGNSVGFPRGQLMRRKALSAISVTVVLAVIVSSLFFVNRSGEKLELGRGSWPMPGGTPSRTSYLPYAPRSELRELWNTRLEGEFAGPPAVANSRAYVACRNGHLYSLNLGNGRPVWKYDAGRELTCMPAVSGRGILLATVDGRVICLDAEGERLWEVEVGGAVMATPLPWEEKVYFGSSDGFVYCVSAADGTRRWAYQADGPLEVSPCGYQGYLLAASREGSLFALDAESGRLLWTYRFEGLPVAFPVIDEGRVYLATETGLHCADLQSGRRLWRYDIGVAVVSNPVVRGSKVFMVKGGGGKPAQALCLDARTGDHLWDAFVGEVEAWTCAFATNSDLYLASVDRLQAIEVETGIPSLQVGLEGVLSWTLTVSEDFILAGTEKSKVYCFGE